jgi:putative component of membrane protein insertase Oxa1/YidC/SpoIIIJ protein YidD
LTCRSQQIDLKKDLQLIESLAKQQSAHSHKRPYIFANQPKTIKNCNPVSLLYGGTLYVYQNYISQHFSANCLYDPGCSDFSKQVVKEFGLIKGGLLTFDRLSRCNRIAGADLDLSKFNEHTHRFSDPIIQYK